MGPVEVSAKEGAIENQPAAVLIVASVLPGVSDQFHLARSRRRLRLLDVFGPFH
jgi:hypothetical protein